MTNNYQRLNEAANLAAHKSESEAIERERERERERARELGEGRVPQAHTVTGR